MPTRSYSAVIVAGNQPFFLATALDISLNLQASGENPIVFDLESVCYVNTNQYNSILCKIFRISNPLKKFILELAKHQIKYVRLEKVDPTHNVPLDLTISKEQVTSCAISTMRDENPSSVSLNRMSPNLVQEFEDSCALLTRSFGELGTPNQIHIPNGRFPHQEAASQVGEKVESQRYYYERWFEKHTYFHMNFRTLDRIAIQRLFFHEETIDSKTSFDNARKWFNSRLNRFGDLDDYTWGWSESQKGVTVRKESRVKSAAIFTSSEDETKMLGGDWDAFEWQSQWHAIRLAVENLTERGYEIAIRIHPNLSNKSGRSYRRTIKLASDLKRDFDSISIIRHDADVDSYELGKGSDLVIVWNSTLGLEFEALGKPVYFFAPSIYSGVTSARPWHKHFLDESLEFDISSNPNLAEKYMEYLLSLGRPFSQVVNESFGNFSPTGKRALLVQWLSSERNVHSSVTRVVSVLLHRSVLASLIIVYRKMKLSIFLK